MNWFPGRTPSPPRHCTALTGSVRRRSTSICSPPCGWWRRTSVRRRSRAPMRSSSTGMPHCPVSCSPQPSTFRPGVHRRKCPAWPRRAGLWASLARSGRKSSAGLRPVYHCGVRAEAAVYTMDFGRFNPQHALKQAQKYGQEREISTSQAMACFTMDQPEFAAEPGGPRCILNGLDSELTDALFQISLTCPAVAAHITCNADLSITEIAYHPLWLEREPESGPMQRRDVKNAGIIRTHGGMLCVTYESGGK